jgi:hypothetical protein
MSNGSTGGGGTPSTNGNNQIDIPGLNNGVKLLGEAVVPGASLLLENHIGAGVLVGAAGLLGGAALGSAFGPLGYLLGRYGASVVSFSQSLQTAPTTTTPPPAPPPSADAIGAAILSHPHFQTILTAALVQAQATAKAKGAH